MKKITLLLCMLISTLAVNGQTSKKEDTSLPNVKDIITHGRFDKTLWSLYVDGDKKYTAKKNTVVATDFKTYINKEKQTTDDMLYPYNLQLLKKYENNIDSLFRKMSLLGTDQLSKFLYMEDGIPVHFGKYNDSALTLIISGVCIDNVYNTLRLTSRQRATKVLTAYVFTSLKYYTDNFKDSDIKYFGFTILFGSKDFSSKDIVLNEMAEYLTFTAPSDMIRKYVSGDITEDDLLFSSDIYISDRDMVVDVKKIKLTLE